MENIKKHLDFITDYSKLEKTIQNSIEDYLVKNKMKSVVVGISGGIDSALICALAKPVCDKIGIPLIGRSISITTNKKDEEDRADNIGEFYCHNYEHLDMSYEYNSMLSEIEPKQKEESDKEYKIRLGNIKARIRMIKLCDLSQAYKGLVLGTDNLTELLLGFFTKYGDEVSGYSAIQYLWKTEVYGLTEYILNNNYSAEALQHCLNCDATDGLGITSTDLDQILPDWRERHTTTRQGYKEVDEMFIKYFRGDLSLENSEPVQRYYRTMFKRNTTPTVYRDEMFQ